MWQSFFFYIVRIYVLSLLFLVYSVHINYFFFSIVRICILSLFFLFIACTSVILFFYKNLHTFFFLFLFTACTLKKRFNIPVYLNLSLSISKRTWQTKLVQSKKYWNNNMRTFFPILVIPLPQLVCHKFFFPSLFRQYHYHFFFFPHNFGNGIVEIGKKNSAMALPKLWGKKKNFPHNFGNGITEIVGEKKNFPQQFWQWHCQNCGEKKKIFFS